MMLSKGLAIFLLKLAHKFVHSFCSFLRCRCLYWHSHSKFYAFLESAGSNTCC